MRMGIGIDGQHGSVFVYRVCCIDGKLTYSVDAHILHR